MDQTRIIKRLKLLEASCRFAVCLRRQPSLVPRFAGRAMVSENGTLCGWVHKEGSETIAAGRDDSPASLENGRACLFTSPIRAARQGSEWGLGGQSAFAKANGVRMKLDTQLRI